jgi:hypothetical protein
MSVTNAFRDAVDQGNIRAVRIMMKNSLLTDPTFKEFAEMEKAAAPLKGRLYDAHDGRELIQDESAWTEDYMNKLMVQVVANFSHERLEHLKKVVRYLNPVESDPEESNAERHDHHGGTKGKRPMSAYQKQKQKDQENGRYIGTKATCTAAGAVAGGLIAAAAGIPVVGGVVVGAAVGCAVGVAVSSGEIKR